MPQTARYIHRGQPRRAARQRSFCLKSRVRRFVTNIVGRKTTNTAGPSIAIVRSKGRVSVPQHERTTSPRNQRRPRGKTDKLWPSSYSDSWSNRFSQDFRFYHWIRMLVYLWPGAARFYLRWGIGSKSREAPLVVVWDTLLPSFRESSSSGRTQSWK
jgi:hypothetical protein